jgi:formamidopyrimidine-DNA glycosylase
MPELPEVHTTVTELNSLISGKKIIEVWTSYKSYFYKNQIKNPKYFKKFKKEVCETKISNVTRRAKNVLINLDNNKSILIHMKMTGHLLYGKYNFENETWIPKDKGPLQDKMNGWIRLVFTLNNGKHLTLSDLRKFAKVTLENDLEKIGPEPLEKVFDLQAFSKQINKKPNGKIKSVLLNQELIAGIGNIYSDESLWMSHIHPETLVKDLSESKRKVLLKNIKEVLNKGIKFSGDSMSDYRRPDGTPGNFQKHHSVYQRKNLDCKRKTCKGKITRIVVGGRGTHYCPECQKS